MVLIFILKTTIRFLLLK